MLHFLDVALEFGFSGLKLGPNRLNVVLQFSLDGLNLMLQFGFEGLMFIFQAEFQFFKGLSVSGLVFLKLMFQFGLNPLNVIFQFGLDSLKLCPDLLKVVFQGEFQRLEVWLGGEVFITAGLPPGDDFGLGFRHVGAGQALDEGMRVKGDLRFHKAQNSGWGGGCKVRWRCPDESAPACLLRQAGGRDWRGLCCCG